MADRQINDKNGIYFILSYLLGEWCIGAQNDFSLFSPCHHLHMAAMAFPILVKQRGGKIVEHSKIQEHTNLVLCIRVFAVANGNVPMHRKCHNTSRTHIHTAVIVSWKWQRVKSLCHCVRIVRLLPAASQFYSMTNCACLRGWEAETKKIKRKTHEQKLTFTHLPFVMQKYASLYCTKIYLLKSLAPNTQAQIHFIPISLALFPIFSHCLCLWLLL